MRKVAASLLLILIPVILIAQDNRSRLSFDYFQSGEYEKAAPIFLKLYEENKVRTYLDYYVRCLVELKDYDNAVNALRKAMRQTNDQTLNVILGYVYEQSGDYRRSEAAYNDPFKNFPSTAQGIISLANSYLTYAKYELAQAAYALGRKSLANPDEFRMELAGVFYAQRRYPEMLEEYFALLLNQPQFLPTVLAYIDNALTRDIDGNLLQLVKDKTISSIQQLPGIQVYYEILVWVLTAEKQFAEAMEHSIAIDRRGGQYDDKILSLARTAVEGGDLDPAIEGYSYLVQKGVTEPATLGQVRNIPSPRIYQAAKVEHLLTSSLKLSRTTGTTPQEWQNLVSRMKVVGDELATEFNLTQNLVPEIARIQAYRLQEHEEALQTIEKALAIKGTPPPTRSRFLMEKGDILLATGDPWEATFVFSMVDMENPDNPTGSEAKLRKAQLSWFTGNFRWALAQLDVLKGSTSRPIANDAMELSVLIRDNISGTDSLESVLRSLAEVDYLIFRKQPAQALVLIDSLINLFPDEAVTDDCLFKKARIYTEMGRQDLALPVFTRIADEYRYDFWGHKAIYELGCLYQDAYHNPVKALEYFEILIREFPNSFHFVDARDRLRALRDAGIRSEPDTQP
ncbi:MAG: tetratricopeptide repeat protein [Bacteroidales bacterium]